MAAGMLLNWSGQLIVPGTPQADQAVAANFERFDGLSQPPLENPAYGVNAYGDAGTGCNPRTGQLGQPAGQVYTPGPISGVVGVVGGQPLPVAACINRAPGLGDYTKVISPGVQHRFGVGQAYQGAAQTVALSEITGNPPQPGDLTSIIAGYD